MIAAAAIVTSGCTSGADDDAGSESGESADAVTESPTVTLPPCVPKTMPEGASIRMMVAPRYVATLQGNALNKEGISPKSKLTVSRRTRGELVQLGTLDANFGTLRFELPRGDVTETSFVLDFGASTRPLSKSARTHLGELYSVLVMKDGWLGDAVATRCEGGGT